jgi:hypothetical protein
MCQFYRHFNLGPHLNAIRLDVYGLKQIEGNYVCEYSIRSEIASISWNSHVSGVDEFQCLVLLFKKIAAELERFSNDRGLPITFLGIPLSDCF